MSRFLAIAWLIHTALGQAVAAPAGAFWPDRLLVQPKPGLAGQVSRLAAVHHGRVVRTLKDSGQLQIVALPPGSDVMAAARACQASGLYVFAEPDYRVHAAAVPDDPEYRSGMLWGLDNQGQNGGVADVDIDAPEGWDVIHDASSVVVAMLDSGIRYSHEDLRGNRWINPAETAGNGLDDDQNEFVDDVYGINALTGTGDPMDDYGHGTHIASIVGAVGNNGRGVTGVAWKVQLMACKMLDEHGDGTISAAIQCLDYARLKGAHIINASWQDTDYSEALRSALVRVREAGIIVVAAAGNGGTDLDLTPTYPAAYGLDNLVAVAAVNRSGELPGYSNYGAQRVDLAAPGSDIYAAWNGADWTYTYYNGTSMAAPHVAGILALLKAAYPAESSRDLINRVLVSAKPLEALRHKCRAGGMASLARALQSPFQAGFTALPAVGEAPLAVQFEDHSTGAVALAWWDFGDGSLRVTNAQASHVYAQNGSFLATRTIRSTNGIETTASQRVSVGPAAGAPGLSLSPAEGLTFTNYFGHYPLQTHFTWALANTASHPVPWRAWLDQTWIQLTPAAGTLEPGQATNLNLAINDQLLAFIPGEFQDALHVENLLDGRDATTRLIQAVVKPVQPPAFNAIRQVDSTTLEAQLAGQPGLSYRIEMTADLAHWETWRTIRCETESPTPLAIPWSPEKTGHYIRAVLVGE